MPRQAAETLASVGQISIVRVCSTKRLRMVLKGNYIEESALLATRFDFKKGVTDDHGLHTFIAAHGMPLQTGL